MIIGRVVIPNVSCAEINTGDDDDVRTDHLVIIAGGRGTRLGPLVGSTSKALVSVGQRPIIVQQVVGLGVERVTVVASPDTLGQVRDVLSRGLPPRFHVNYLVQDVPRGPLDAVKIAIGHCYPYESVLVLFADTLVDWGGVPHEGTWIGVGRSELRRPWCYRAELGWRDGVPEGSRDIFIGLLRVEHATQLVRAASVPDVDMGAALNMLTHTATAHTEPIPGWCDTGDLLALAGARRWAFRTRDTSKIELTDYGTVIKHGVSPGQVHALTRSDASPLYPRARALDESTVEMDYVSAPSLAELYLYGSPNVAAWTHILDTVIDRCERFLWKRVPLAGGSDRARAMYCDKVRERTVGSGVSLRDVDSLCERLEPLIASANDRQATIHGDLNFCNILYDVGSDVVRLIDPRGSWGDRTVFGDLLYEAAKLRYSWRAFAAINHDVYGRPNDTKQLIALDRALFLRLLGPLNLTLEDCAGVEASLFWSAIPLHPPHHRDALVEVGYVCLEEACSSQT